jgi:hypothetical protein
MAHAAHLDVQATRTSRNMRIHEHNRIVLEPVLFYAAGMYHPTQERKVIEYDEEYELNVTE